MKSERLTAATIASFTMKGEPNQSSLLPSSSTACNEARPTAIVAMPNQSPSASVPLDANIVGGIEKRGVDARPGRRFRGLDIDPAYVDVAIERWSARTGLEPRLEGPTS